MAGGSEHPSEVQIITPEDIDPGLFKTYRKTGLTKARLLTDSDFALRNGVVKTLEGEASFSPGDYLAVGPKGEEYPIRVETFTNTKEIVGEKDPEGWANYRTTTTVQAASVNKAFGVQCIGTQDVALGKPGDYFVDSGKRQYVVDKEIFERTYETIPHINTHQASDSSDTK